jgi:hypothetical protein
MKIESGTTTEHRVRLGIFLAMCVVFAGYFGYDGLWGYPGQNREWARQGIDVPGDKKADIWTNPKVLVSEAVQIEEGMTEDEVRSRLGEPAVVVEAAGLPRSKDHWYVGPAAYARIQFSDGKVRGKVHPVENETKSESDIRFQKILGLILGVVSLVVGAYYIRINTWKTVVDESGLTSKGHHVPWDHMTGLDTSDYDRKGWLDVVYGRNGDTDTLRLDSYHIDRFDEIVNTICERKGFACPIRPKQSETAEDTEERA